MVVGWCRGTGPRQLHLSPQRGAGGLSMPPQAWPSTGSREPEMLPQKEGEGTKEIPEHPHITYPTHWI